MSLFQSVLTIAFLEGCVHATPPELLQARSAYQHAEAGPARELRPAELHLAHQALEVAEASFKDDPKGYETRDLSYVAQRSAQKADAMGRIETDRAKTERANAVFAETQARLVTDTKAALVASEAAGAQGAARLATSETARREADLRTADAIAAGKAADARTAAALAALATSKQEERGLVITLSGSVLFRSAESTLMPEATKRLDQVAAALLETKERRLVVEGHTDSDGEDAYNQTLSQKRADAVRTYLISRGYSAGLITANGIGEGRPVAQNTSDEGKANNRRVEIVVSR